MSELSATVPQPLSPRGGRDLLVRIGLPPEKRLQRFAPDDLEIVFEPPRTRHHPE